MTIRLSHLESNLSHYKRNLSDSPDNVLNKYISQWRGTNYFMRFLSSYTSFHRYKRKK